MPFFYEEVLCQTPRNGSHVNRDYVVVKAVSKDMGVHKARLRNQAWRLAQKVNPRAANDSCSTRDKERLILDACGGVLAEWAWFSYINSTFGEGTVRFTEFDDAANQIDLLLNNGKTIEVRSSFPRNGIKFALCNERYNFKNICKYSNLYKSSETNKDFFACVLIETPKQQIMQCEEVVLYLVGGSTRAMMEDDRIAFETTLTAEDDLTQVPTKYRVIKLQNALDMHGFERYMTDMGYRKQLQAA